jgi:hypothetical protein
MFFEILITHKNDVSISSSESMPNYDSEFQIKFKKHESYLNEAHRIQKFQCDYAAFKPDKLTPIFGATTIDY